MSALKNKCLSAEHKRKISEANKGKLSIWKDKHLPEETKRKISEARKGQLNSEEARKKMSKAHTGISLSDETKKKMSKARKGRCLSDEWKQNISKAHKGRYPSKKSRAKMSKSQKGRQHSEETKRKMSEARIIYMSSGKHKFKNTSIEVSVENELIRRKIPYLKQAPILGIALVDFLLPNKIIIQCDGDYWHSRVKNKGKDIAQDTILYFKGYEVFRFWEKEIKKSVKKCIDKIFFQKSIEERR